MRLSDILQPGAITCSLAASAKQQAIFELVDLLVKSENIGNAADLKQAIWDREQARTTGIGHGIAIPHGKSKGVAKLCMAIGKVAAPIDFGAIDNRPVELIFLLASPPDQTGPHIQALAAISKMLVDESFRAAMKRATSAEQLYQLITDREAKSVA
jgi:fructose-specific phosphotransferase system IIA component